MQILVVDFLDFISNFQYHIYDLHLFLAVQPFLYVLQQPIKTINRHLYFGTSWLTISRALTMCDSASSWRTLSFLAIDWYRVLYQPLKFADLKNRLYKPSQLPLTLVVKWGPEDSSDAIKSSGLNGNGRGALCKMKIK